jgi:Xaa-Pro aminopeptidase
VTGLPLPAAVRRAARPDWQREIATDVLARAAETLATEEPFRLGFDDAHTQRRASTRGWPAWSASRSSSCRRPARAVEGLRARKDPAELDRLRAAAALADRALEDVLGRGLAGRPSGTWRSTST